MSEVVIRPHTSDDHGAIVALRWLLKSGDGLRADEEDRIAFETGYAEHLRCADAAGNTVHWLIERDRSVIGVMTVRLVDKETSLSGSTGRWGYLTNSIVAPDARNQGYGTLLLDRIKTWANDQGLELLIVWPSERSYAFYRRAGFTGNEDPLQLILNEESD